MKTFLTFLLLVIAPQVVVWGGGYLLAQQIEPITITITEHK